MSRTARLAMIDRRHGALPVVRQCELLGVARSSVYYEPVPAHPADLDLMRRIDEQYLRTPFYGSRRMTAWLRRAGHGVGRKRVRRLMGLMGIEAIYQKPNTSRKHPENKIYPYLLRDLTIDRVNQVWCSDITYIPMAKGFLYLVAVMDWASRRVLAWRLSNTLDAEFCVDALEEALVRHGRPEIFNTDQGSQFTSAAFTGLLVEHGVAISMDGKGRFLDNILIERLWRSLKYEEVFIKAYATVAEARAGIGGYLSTTMSAPIRRWATERRARSSRLARPCGYVDDRLRRTAALPPCFPWTLMPRQASGETRGNAHLRPHTHRANNPQGQQQTEIDSYREGRMIISPQLLHA
jgi:putative transposase